MTIFLTGATGYIGGAVLELLISQGTQVTAVVRSETAADKVRAKGAEAAIVDLSDVAALGRLLAGVDGAIHTASPGDTTSAAFDTAVIDAVLAEFGGTEKHYVHTSGVWIWGSQSRIVENSPLDPPAIVAWRLEQEQRLLESTVAATIVAPGIVYGEGGGIANIILDAPGAGTDAVTLIGDGAQCWGTVHVRDLAKLYVLALESNPGGRLIGASGSVAVADLYGAAHPGAKLMAEDPEATRSRLGAQFADALLLDQVVSEQVRSRDLGWRPTEASLQDELAAGYRTAGQPA